MVDGYVIAPAPVASVAVSGSRDRFPVRRIYCVGRNYLEHVREMGNDEREPPIFFQKPADAVVDGGAVIAFPTVTTNLHHEVELVVALGGGGSDIAGSDALSLVWGYGVAIDLTRRDLQIKGKPWEVAKSFDQSCPCGPLSPVGAVGHIEAGRIALAVNGETRQESDIGLLIWKLPEIIARLSTLFELRPGDLILTGTPHGVGPLEPSDRIDAGVAGLEPLTVTIGQPRA